MSCHLSNLDNSLLFLNHTYVPGYRYINDPLLFVFLLDFNNTCNYCFTSVISLYCRVQQQLDTHFPLLKVFNAYTTFWFIQIIFTTQHKVYNMCLYCYDFSHCNNLPHSETVFPTFLHIQYSTISYHICHRGLRRFCYCAVYIKDYNPFVKSSFLYSGLQFIDFNQYHLIHLIPPPTYRTRLVTARPTLKTPEHLSLYVAVPFKPLFL